MSAYERISKAFHRHFAELQSLEMPSAPTPHNFERFMLSRSIGQYCYLAEEMLEPDALTLLKCDLYLSEQQWKTFKRKGIWGLDIVIQDKQDKRDDFSQ